jgi:hypothetical protein
MCLEATEKIGLRRLDGVFGRTRRETDEKAAIEATRQRKCAETAARAAEER